MINETTHQSLEAILRSIYPTGSIVDIKVETYLVGQKPLCQERTKWSKCEAVLEDDGSCPSVSSHKVEENDYE